MMKISFTLFKLYAASALVNFASASNAFQGDGADDGKQTIVGGTEVSCSFTCDAFLVNPFNGYAYIKYFKTNITLRQLQDGTLTQSTWILDAVVHLLLPILF